MENAPRTHLGLEVRMDLAEVDHQLLLDSEKMAQICEQAATEAGATIRGVIHRSLGADSPPGLTLAILLDESHVTAHSYADLGLLALNAFTCGTKADPIRILQLIHEKVGGHTIFGPDAQKRFALNVGQENW